MRHFLKGFVLSSVILLPLVTGAVELPIENNSCEFIGSFEQKKFIVELDSPLSSSGQFYHHCEHGVIWSTTSPVNETLVMRKSGKGFLINDTGSKKLKSRHGKFLSKLLNGLMSNNQELLEQQFSISSVKANQFQLVPSKRRLKRGIIKIDLLFNNDSLTISVIDRNSQKTEITAKKNKFFKQDSMPESAKLNCLSTLTNEVCSQLFSLNDSPKKIGILNSQTGLSNH